MANVGTYHVSYLDAKTGSDSKFNNVYQNTVRRINGYMDKAPKTETRTGEEIIAHFKERLGS